MSDGGRSDGANSWVNSDYIPACILSSVATPTAPMQQGSHNKMKNAQPRSKASQYRGICHASELWHSGRYLHIGFPPSQTFDL